MPQLRNGLWEHQLSTPQEIAYVNAQPDWRRFEGPRPFRAGDLIRLYQTEWDIFIRESGAFPAPALLDRRRALTPVKSCHVIIPKPLP